MHTLRLLRMLLGENGVVWTACFALNIPFRFRSRILNRIMAHLEKKRNLPGISGKAVNYEIWEHWNWGSRGEEWTESEEWKESVIHDVLLKYAGAMDVVLEIGPGAGRWTETLQELSPDLLVVDISPATIEACKKRFSHCGNIRYYVNDGSRLPFVPAETVDFIWSFDVFVHISPNDIEQYLRECRRILRKGSRAVIHHANEGGLHGGFRSRMTGDLFVQMLERQGLSPLSQFDTWGEGGRFGVRGYRDAITVFEK